MVYPDFIETEINREYLEIAYIHMTYIHVSMELIFWIKKGLCEATSFVWLLLCHTFLWSDM